MENRLFIVGVVNSSVGKPGNIGVRYARVKRRLDDLGIENVTFARGNYAGLSDVKTISFLSYFVRALHYLRRNMFRQFNSRRVDVLIFELMFFARIWPQLIRGRSYGRKIAYVVESSPRIIRFLRCRGFRIIYDVPIAPNSYVNEVLKRFPNCGLVYQSYLERLERESLRLSDEVIVPSEFVLTEVRKILQPCASTRLIPFGADSIPFSVAVKGGGEGLDYVFAGNISLRKGIEFLLRCWSRPEFRHDRLHLCGAMTRDASELIKALELDNVIAPGFVDVKTYFVNCDVYVFPSLMEGSSKSVYEAMSAGLPCIVTRESGSIISDRETGLIVQAFSEEALFNAMVAMKKVDRQAMGLRAKESVAAYTWEKYVDRVVEVLCEDG